MKQYIMYILISSSVIASPGPGVMLTLKNTINYGPRRAVYGIIGIVSGMGVIAVFAASSTGIMVSQAPFLLDIIKVVGAIYLAYLGIRMLRRAAPGIEIVQEYTDLVDVRENLGRFFQGLSVTFSNPKLIVFFMALFPQFIVLGDSYIPQFSLLLVTFCGLMVLIHALYGGAALVVRSKIKNGRVLEKINMIGGGAFIFFAVVLLYSAIG